LESLLTMLAQGIHHVGVQRGLQKEVHASPALMSSLLVLA